MATWTKEQRDLAKTEQLGLVTIAVDGRFLPIETGQFGVFEISGPTSPEMTRELADYLTEFLKKRVRWLQARKLKEQKSK